MPGEQDQGPPAPARRRRRWPWAVVVVSAGLAGLFVARQAVPSHSLPPCPTGHPVAAVKAYHPHLITEVPGPPGGQPSSLYQLTVDYEVRNDGSAPVLVDSVHGTVLGQPQIQVVAEGQAARLDPGGSTVVSGTVDVSTPGLTAQPVPDSTAVTLAARWADERRYPGCDT